MKKSKSKSVGVFFSSGLDSTYLVWKNLSDGNIVIPIYIEIENNLTKTIIEKNRIKLLCNLFSKEFNTDKDELLKPIQYIAKFNVDANESALYFKQIPVWILGSMFCQSLDISEIQIGYVSNDDAASYLNDIKKIYHSYQPISDKLKKLKFPLKKMKKCQLAEKLPQKYLDLIYSCENPKNIGLITDETIKYEPCCYCLPCRTIIASNYYELNNFPEIYKKGLIDIHVSALSRDGYQVYDNENVKYNQWEIEAMPESMTIGEQLKFDFNCDKTMEYDEMINVGKEVSVEHTRLNN